MFYFFYFRMHFSYMFYLFILGCIFLVVPVETIFEAFVKDFTGPMCSYREADGAETKNSNS